MTFNRPRPGNSIFSGRALPPQPETFPAGGDPLAFAASPRPCDAADTLSPEQDLPGATHSHSPLPSDPTATGRRADIVCLSDVEPRPAEWLWQDRLASCALSMLSGDPGVGKTWVALAIATALSRGRAPFGGQALEPCTVLYASTENEGSEVVCPPFAKLDGDASRLVLLRGVVSGGSGQSTSLSLRDTPALEEKISKPVRRQHDHLGLGSVMCNFEHLHETKDL